MPGKNYSFQKSRTAPHYCERQCHSKYKMPTTDALQETEIKFYLIDNWGTAIRATVSIITSI